LTFHASTLESPLGFRNKIPAWVLLPFKTQVSPVRIFGQDQFELLLAAPALDFLFSHLGADYVRVPLIKHQHVERVLCGKAIGKEFLLVLPHSNDNVVSEASVESTRLVRHDVNPVALHGAAVYHPRMLGRSRFLGIRLRNEGVVGEEMSLGLQCATEDGKRAARIR